MHTCGVCFGNQCGRDIAPTADRDADPHALESSLHWLRHRSRSSCLAAGERHDANITRRARGTPDRVPWCRDDDGICHAYNAAACCAVPSLDWLCCDFGGGPVLCSWPSGLPPGFCVQFQRCFDRGHVGVDRAHLLRKGENPQTHFRRIGAVWVRRARHAAASPSRSEVTL